MPGASREIARERAEKARRGFQNLRLSDRLGLGNAVDAVTISAGVAVFPEHGNEVNQVLKAADEALYAAKRAGKDRVEMSSGNVKAAAREFATAE
jgi:diguanylate cyclase (GGDEF)-like protein